MQLHQENEEFSFAILRWANDFEKTLSRRKDEKTVENYLNVINKFQSFIESDEYFEKLSFKDINHKLLNEYFDFRDSEHRKKTGNELKVSTKKNDKKVLILFFEYIEDENEEEFEFSIKWKRVELGKEERKEKEYHSEDAVEEVLKYLQKNMKKNRDEYSYMLSFTFKIALFGGLRASEICALKIDSFGKPYVSKTSNKKLIPVTIKGKGNTTFTNPINYDYIKNEYNYFKRNKKPEEVLFRSKTGSVLNRFHLYRYFESISNELKLGKKGVHIIRRTFASKLNELGVDIRNIQLLMRHTDIKTTSIYTARSQKQMDDAASKL